MPPSDDETALLPTGDRFSVLIVEDDRRISDVLEYALEADGYAVRLVQRGREAVQIAETNCPGLILLDVGLPDIDGFEVCRLVRKFSEVPILFLTSRADEINRVVGLEIGGDDYVVKPFSTRELLARIKALRRRCSRPDPKPAPEPEPSEIIRLGPVELDPARFRVTCGGKEVSLTAQEFRMLELLLRAPGRVFTRDQILDRAWPDGGAVTDRTIDAHVKSLRRKFPEVDFIETIRGVGYRVRSEA